jgi:hypothetical protein
MDTVLAPPAKLARRLPDPRYDRLFFSAVALLMLIAVWVGFARSYYLAGVFTAPLPASIIHLHGAIFSAWFLLFALQTGLISARKVALHRTLGLAGFGLAILVVIFALLAMASQLRFRANISGILAFSAHSFNSAISFAILAGLAYATRVQSSAAHKRLIVIANVPLLSAALNRWTVPYLRDENFHHALLASNIFLLLMAIYDLWSLHKIHRATLWGSVFAVFMQQIAWPLGSTAAWQVFARWVQSMNV